MQYITRSLPCSLLFIPSSYTDHTNHVPPNNPRTNDQPHTLPRRTPRPRHHLGNKQQILHRARQCPRPSSRSAMARRVRGRDIPLRLRKPRLPRFFGRFSPRYPRTQPRQSSYKTSSAARNQNSGSLFVSPPLRPTRMDAIPKRRKMPGMPTGSNTSISRVCIRPRGWNA